MVFTCEECKKEFNFNVSLQRHLKNIHNKTIKGKKNYICMEEQCDSSFRLNSELAEHLKTAHSYDVQLEEKKCSSVQVLEYNPEGLLIEVIQPYEHLYNMRHKYYKNNTKKEKAWTDIANIVNIPAEECKKYWVNIRDKYMRKRRENALGSATFGSDTFMAKMSFYDKFCKPRKRFRLAPRLVKSEFVNTAASSSTQSSMDAVVYPESPNMPCKVLLGDPDDMNEVENTTNTANGGNEEDMTLILSTANKLAESIQSKNQQTPEGLNEAFAAYVVSRLNEMSPEESRQRRKNMLKVLEDL